MSVSSSGAVSILVMGVGRSGTTAIYGLLQRILEDRFPGDVDYVYEPFLWDRSTFNKLYSELTNEFTFASSLSLDGVYHHKQLPILVTEGAIIDQGSKEWLARTLNPTGGKRHYLGKMIRGNGRIRLIRELAPTTKIIFLIRNPVDVLNSATQLFSLYGKEFYRSDFDRFATEVEARFQTRIRLGPDELSEVEAEYSYWYFSNLAFLEYAKANPDNILSVSYEAFVENRADIVRRICEFVALDFNPDFSVTASKVLGSVRQNTSALGKREYSFLREKMEEYNGLLALVDCRPSVSVEQQVRTTQWIDDGRVRGDRQYFNGFHASRKLREIELKLTQLEKDHAQVVAELSKRRYRSINWLLAPVDRLRQFKARREDD